MATKKSTEQSKPKPARDIARDYPRAQFIAKLRRLADCLEQGRAFQVNVAGERIVVPPDARVQVEHEREGASQELELQLLWRTE